MISFPAPKFSGVIANTDNLYLAARAVSVAAYAAATARERGLVLMEMLHGTTLAFELDDLFRGRLALKSKYSDGYKTLRQTGMPQGREISAAQPDSVREAWLCSDLEGASNASRRTPPPCCAFSIAMIAPPRSLAAIDTRQYVMALALPPGMAKLPWDAPAELVIERACDAFGVLPRDIEVTGLLRDENREQARAFNAAGAKVRLFPNGAFELFAGALAPVEGGRVRIAFGRAGALEAAMFGAALARASGGHLVVQPLDASGAPVGPALEADRLVKSDDVLLTAASIVSPGDGSGLLEGLRRDSSGRAWIKCLVASPAIGPTPVHFVASFVAGGEFESLTPVEPSLTLDAHLLRSYLEKNGELTSSIPDGEAEYFHHEPCVAGFEGRNLVRALNDACEAGFIDRDSQFPGPDGSLERVTYSSS